MSHTDISPLLLEHVGLVLKMIFECKEKLPNTVDRTSFTYVVDLLNRKGQSKQVYLKVLLKIILIFHTFSNIWCTCNFLLSLTVYFGYYATFSTSVRLICISATRRHTEESHQHLSYPWSTWPRWRGSQNNLENQSELLFTALVRYYGP